MFPLDSLPGMFARIRQGVLRFGVQNESKDSSRTEVAMRPALRAVAPKGLRVCHLWLQLRVSRVHGGKKKKTSVRSLQFSHSNMRRVNWFAKVSSFQSSRRNSVGVCGLDTSWSPWLDLAVAFQSVFLHLPYFSLAKKKKKNCLSQNAMQKTKQCFEHAF